MNPQIAMTWPRRESTWVTLQVNMATVAGRLGAADISVIGNKFKSIMVKLFRNEQLRMCTG